MIFYYYVFEEGQTGINVIALVTWRQCVVFHSEVEIPVKPSLENRLNEVTLQSFENDKQGENEEDYDYDDDEDDEWDWSDSGGRDFTKRYTAVRAGNNPQVFHFEGLWPHFTRPKNPIVDNNPGEFVSIKWQYVACSAFSTRLTVKALIISTLKCPLHLTRSWGNMKTK